MKLAPQRPCARSLAHFSAHFSAHCRIHPQARPHRLRSARLMCCAERAGQRIFKSQPSNPKFPQTAQLGAIYLYADDSAGLPSWALMSERTNGGSNLTVNSDYVWLPLDDGRAIPVAVYNGTRFYNIHSDHLGSPRLITSDTAQPVWQWPYSAFGETQPTGPLQITTSNGSTTLKASSATLESTVRTALEFNLRFAGQYADSETGLFYNYYRSYLAGQGRYTQNDPIGLDGGLNRFIYVGGDALNENDPEGLKKTPKIYYPVGNIPQRVDPTAKPSDASLAAARRELAGLFSPPIPAFGESYLVCQLWDCPKSSLACSLNDIKTTTDFIPSATNPNNPPLGCMCISYAPASDIFSSPDSGIGQAKKVKDNFGKTINGLKRMWR